MNIGVHICKLQYMSLGGHISVHTAIITILFTNNTVMSIFAYVSVNLWENFCGAITGKWSPGCKGASSESLLDVDKLRSKAGLPLSAWEHFMYAWYHQALGNLIIVQRQHSVVLILISLIANEVYIHLVATHVFQSTNCLFTSLPIFLFCFYLIDVQEIDTYSRHQSSVNHSHLLLGLLASTVSIRQFLFEDLYPLLREHRIKFRLSRVFQAPTI